MYLRLTFLTSRLRLLFFQVKSNGSHRPQASESGTSTLGGVPKDCLSQERIAKDVIAACYIPNIVLTSFSLRKGKATNAQFVGS